MTPTEIAAIREAVACDCNLEERNDGSLPAGFVRHANWCRSQSQTSLQLRTLLAEVERLEQEREDARKCEFTQGRLRDAAEAELARLRPIVEAVRELEKKWAQEAHEIDQDGDFCCAQTRRHDAGELHALLTALEDTP